MTTELMLKDGLQKQIILTNRDKTQLVHKNKSGEYFFKEKDGRSYTNVHTATSNIYTVGRYYRRNKSILLLWNLIVKIKQANKINYSPYFCVIYSRLSNEYDENHPIIQSHGNSKFETEIDRPYIRTSKAILLQQAEMALSGISATEIYGTHLTQTDPYTSKGQSIDSL